MVNYVIFKEAQHDFFFKPFCKSGFTHCLVVRSVCADYFWLIVDPNIHNTHIELVSKKEKPTIEDLVGECTIVQINSEIDLNTVCYTLSFNTCVDVVKRILGIRAAFCLTPYQLYKRLSYGMG